MSPKPVLNDVAVLEIISGLNEDSELPFLYIFCKISRYVPRYSVAVPRYTAVCSRRIVTALVSRQLGLVVFRRKKLVIRLANAGGLAGWLAGGLAGGLAE
ncbi:hypothetical protein DPMN_002477 [Dreissena polymorpha]|uniref:Uncharacterized protein n=1 Tax=Dreissena polymorpha TaxID=45954 RepID=A0A9D4RTW1_DREPO|nr:hypothetical protein DPMN_002477 [Dreissena polymorpha]